MPLLLCYDGVGYVVLTELLTDHDEVTRILAAVHMYCFIWKVKGKGLWKVSP